MTSFWNQDNLIGLAPMDGVTDAAYRYIVDIYGKPDLLMTEFVPVDALNRGAFQAMRGFALHTTRTPTVAQIFGTDLDAFYKATLVIAELGFDGVDINMGCPDRSVAKKGAGAGLIRTPDLAKSIIRTVQTAVKDWSEGKTMQEGTVHERIIEEVSIYQKRYKIISSRKMIPVSVKTRIGYDRVQTDEWIKHVLETQPDNLTVHGRTLAQMYTGKADWEEIAKAVQLAKQYHISVMGSGDVQSVSEAKDKMSEFGVNGVIIGRASFGNPWIFTEHIPTPQERIEVAKEHARIFTELLPESHYLSMRKHLSWYCRGFHNATSYRERLMQVTNYDEVVAILDPLLDDLIAGKIA